MYFEEKQLFLKGTDLKMKFEFTLLLFALLISQKRHIYYIAYFPENETPPRNEI